MHRFVKLTFTGWNAADPDWWQHHGIKVLWAYKRFSVMVPEGHATLDSGIARRAAERENVTVERVPDSWKL